MTKQIAVHLPDGLVAYLDEQVSGGSATSRAEAIARALRHERRRQLAERDAAIYANSDDDDDLAALTEHAAAVPTDID